MSIVVSGRFGKLMRRLLQCLWSHGRGIGRIVPTCPFGIQIVDSAPDQETKQRQRQQHQKRIADELSPVGLAGAQQPILPEELLEVDTAVLVSPMKRGGRQRQNGGLVALTVAPEHHKLAGQAIAHAPRLLHLQRMGNLKAAHELPAVLGNLGILGLLVQLVECGNESVDIPLWQPDRGVGQ